jgi:carbon starvation protein
LNSLVVLLIAFILLAIGYFLYGKRIDRDIIKSDPDKATPAKMYMDGVDFTPTSRNVLFGYQYKSIAALGPIVGPVVAVRYGWLPALLWIILGTFFIGWVQDYSSQIMPMREEGKTFGGLSYTLISPRARTILLIFIYFYLLLIMGAFGKIVAADLMTNGKIPLGVLMAILVGVLAGQMIYKWKQDIIITTVVVVILAFLFIWIGSLEGVKNFFEILNSPTVKGVPVVWSLVVMLLCFIGGVAAIWRFAQPVNFISFWIVFLGMIATILGILIWHPSFIPEYPVIGKWMGDPAVGPMWPILFVTIACGAISGWHSLVSSSGTARQLEKETDALPVGGGAMWLEMILAVLAIIVTVGAVSRDKYLELAAAGKNAGIFATGMTEFLSHVGIPKGFGGAYAGVFLCLQALTIMWLVVRFMRVASTEFLGDRIPLFKNVYFGAFIAVLLSIIVVWTGVWTTIWILFGSSNQLMAALALFLVSIWLLKGKIANKWVFYPAIFMYVTTMAALGYTVVKDGFMKGGVSGWLSAIIGLILFVAALILGWDIYQAIQKYRAGAPEEKSAE